MRRFTDTHGQQILYDELGISIIIQGEKAELVIICTQQLQTDKRTRAALGCPSRPSPPKCCYNAVTVLKASPPLLDKGANYIGLPQDS